MRDEPYEGVDAAEAYAAADILPPLPATPVLPAEPGQPPSLDTEAAPAPGVDPTALAFLATQTAREAHRLLAEALRPDHEAHPVEPELTAAQDAVRLGVGVPDVLDTPMTARLGEGSDRDREGLELAVRAWEYGGVAALDVLETEWTVEAETLARARAALESAWEGDERPRLRASRNRWTADGGQAQLRLGLDGRWWPYRKEWGRWAPVGPAAQDPATALALAEGRE